ncbi:hypothetical protein C8R43DRAFT_1142433 [Mycena crocata]|nr:hypothetical protein C8R43DRAFT_1142433 [Mycena crocata]
MSHPPPMKSKYASGPSDYELKAQRKLESNEKARLRMARCVPAPLTLHLHLPDCRSPRRKRAELKSRPIEEQLEAAERARVHQATYREKHRNDLRVWEAQRRIAYVLTSLRLPALYLSHLHTFLSAFIRLGLAQLRMPHMYAKNRERKRLRRAKQAAKEAYHEARSSQHAHGDGDNDARDV